MSVADELRAAATRIETLRPNSNDWHVQSDDDSFDDEWKVACDPPPGIGGGGWFVASGVSESFARWSALLGPQVAAPLAAWLRAEATLAESIDHRPDPVAEMLDLSQADLSCYADNNPPALVLARLINTGGAA